MPNSFCTMSPPTSQPVSSASTERKRLREPLRKPTVATESTTPRSSTSEVRSEARPSLFSGPRKNGFWKIVSYESEVEGEDPNLPDIRPAETIEVKRTEGDPHLISVAEDFHRTWLIEKNAKRAHEFLSPRAYSCYNLFRPADRPEAKTSEEAGRYLLEGLERVTRDVPDASSLNEIIEGVEIVDAQLLVVTHPDESAFALVAGPDYQGEGADCAKRAQGLEPRDVKPTLKDYGNYFATGFQFKVDQGQGATLALVWAKEGGEWKIVAYDVKTP